MKRKEIIKKIIKFLGNIEEVKIIESDDFSEERESNMVVVGIENVEQVNVGLPDYKYTLNITIDTFIADDAEGILFDNTVKSVEEKLNKLINRHIPIKDVFEEIPVVGLINLAINYSITSESNRAVITSDVFASF